MAEHESNSPQQPDGPALPPGGATATLTRPRLEKKVEHLPPWNVVLLNDDDHTYEYVILMAQEVFAHTLERAVQIAKTVDSDGRAVLLTTHKERAEFKRDQVLGYGADRLIAHCKGAMSAIIEPAEFGGDESDNADKNAG